MHSSKVPMAMSAAQSACRPRSAPWRPDASLRLGRRVLWPQNMSRSGRVDDTHNRQICGAPHTGCGPRPCPASPGPRLVRPWHLRYRAQGVCGGGGGCLPQPRWAVCATGVGAHQGQTNREGEKNIWWTARTALGGTGHLGRTETQRGRRWTACGQRCVDSKHSQTTPATTSTTPNTPTIGRR